MTLIAMAMAMAMQQVWSGVVWCGVWYGVVWIIYVACSMLEYTRTSTHTRDMRAYTHTRARARTHTHTLSRSQRDAAAPGACRATQGLAGPRPD